MASEKGIRYISRKRPKVLLHQDEAEFIVVAGGGGGGEVNSFETPGRLWQRSRGRQQAGSLFYER